MFNFINFFLLLLSLIHIGMCLCVHFCGCRDFMCEHWLPWIGHTEFVCLSCLRLMLSIIVVVGCYYCVFVCLLVTAAAVVVAAMLYGKTLFFFRCVFKAIIVDSFSCRHSMNNHRNDDINAQCTSSLPNLLYHFVWP